MIFTRDLIAHAARNFRAKTAFIDDQRKASWQEMHQRSDALASAMQNLGVQKGDKSAILSFDRTETLEHFFACAKLGAVRVGVNRGYAFREILHVIHDANAKTLFVEAPLLPLLGQELTTLREEGIIIIGIGTEHGLPLDYDDLLQSNRAPALPLLLPNDEIMLSYTSGTTGLPKGVILSQQGVYTHIVYTALAAEMGYADVWYNPTAMAWVTILLNLLGLVNGMTSVLPGTGFDADRYLDAIGQYKVTRGILAPIMLSRVLQAYKNKPRDTSSFKSILLGSSPSTLPLMIDAFETFKVPVCQWYAMTETSWGALSSLRPEEMLENVEKNPERLLSVGKPGIHVEISIKDEHGHEVPGGQVGEVWLKGEVLAKGYHQLPQETAETFKDGWLRTNDLGRFDEEGYLYLVDRKKFLIISGGVNVYPSAVESALTEHPKIREVAVIGIADAEWGQAVVAFIVPHEGSTLTEQEIIDFAKERLARWEAPKQIVICKELPRGPTQKVKKEALRHMLEKPKQQSS
jgi:acyl-CoA synthetase (AMP-forming)/AMP-acid ligase II